MPQGKPNILVIRGDDIGISNLPNVRERFGPRGQESVKRRSPRGR